MTLPEYFGTHAEIFHKDNLIYSPAWEVVEDWIPTYGSADLTWSNLLSVAADTAFFLVFDASLDLDGDGFSDHREYFITGTDPAFFDSPNADGDDLPDFWELKLFGDIWTQDGYDDSDADTLLNREELVWLTGQPAILYSDPSRADSDLDELRDDAELLFGTCRMDWDSDNDALSDGEELLVRKTDPNNPDTDIPLITFD